jgi:hypothetical protein
VLGREAQGDRKADTSPGVRWDKDPKMDNSSYSERTEFLGPKVFQIDCPHGPVAVAPSELAWATKCSAMENERTRGDHTYFTWTEWVPDGAPVVAAGWVTGWPPRLVARGREPALLLAAYPGDDPLAPVRSILWYWRTALVGLLLVGAALAWLHLQHARHANASAHHPPVAARRIAER